MAHPVSFFLFASPPALAVPLPPLRVGSSGVSKICRYRSLKKMSSAADSKGCDAAPKTVWPELVGCTIKEAKETIKVERPDLNVVVVPVGSIVTQEINPTRVRLWVDTVAQVPKIG
ncbi:hypothetical protein BAE44_0016889 [Dichanthelium oligosanthes]|uniref:Subtilisin-chymotrypsin inhibitor-2A n=1 Tax=Dichanthelium oligosanthes TaxID=888268 RepID=A0A1E5VAA9_9POAL|nr:hypothetical protein BAE44_0016889 [Dichanthelium oligosanthes]